MTNKRGSSQKQHFDFIANELEKKIQKILSHFFLEDASLATLLGWKTYVHHPGNYTGNVPDGIEVHFVYHDLYDGKYDKASHYPTLLDFPPYSNRPYPHVKCTHLVKVPEIDALHRIVTMLAGELEKEVFFRPGNSTPTIVYFFLL